MTALNIVDTDILIDVGRQVDKALRYLTRLEETGAVAISAVSQMELIVGCRNKEELDRLVRFLTRFAILPVDENISNQAVSLLTTYRLSHGLLIADAIIAATAISLNASFSSINQRDYRFIRELNLLPYE
jgi:predicted nucleic acid-binding protein